jgi:hypothetical protein
MRTTNEIIDSIDIRLREVKAEIQTLNAARAALDSRGHETTQRRRRTVTRTARPKPNAAGRKAARAAEVAPAGTLERLLSQDGGLTTSALAERANRDRDQVLALLRELEAAGRIRRTGQRRGTRWHAITDEDRIRERAAELAARRTRPA